MYIAAGWHFRLPISVRPLKALAAIAIARELSPDIIAAGASLMSVSLVVLAATGAIDKLYAIVPSAVVRIQLGLAYVLIRGAFSLLEKPLAPSVPQMSVSVGEIAIPLMLVLTPAFFLLIALLVKTPVVPASLAVRAGGVAVGLYPWPVAQQRMLGPAAISPAFPQLDAFTTAAAVLLTAQLPLTVANSVIATADAAHVSFPDQASRTTPRRLSITIALGNLPVGLFGELPLCHGCDGLWS